MYVCCLRQAGVSPASHGTTARDLVDPYLTSGWDKLYGRRETPVEA